MRRVLPLIAGGKLRHDIQIGVDIEELVAHASEHDAPDIGGAEGGIEQVRVLAQADMQDLVLRQYRNREAKDAGSGKQETAHEVLPSGNVTT